MEGSVPGFRIAVAPELALDVLARIFVKEGKDLSASLGKKLITGIGPALSTDSVFVVRYVSIDEVLEPS